MYHRGSIMHIEASLTKDVMKMAKFDLDLDKVKGGNKITLGQLQEMSVAERTKAIEPIIKANSAQFARLAETIAEAADFTKTIRSSLVASFNSPIYEMIKNIRMPEIPDVSSMMTPMPNIDLVRYSPPVNLRKSNRDIEREEREAYMNELHIKLLEQQLNLVKGIQTPQYDISTGHLSFMGKTIEIPLNTNLEMVCRIVLKNVRNMAKRWSWEEIVEEARESTDNFTSTQIYTAARAVNDKVAQEVQVKDFFITKPITTIRLDLKFVPK